MHSMSDNGEDIQHTEIMQLAQLTDEQKDYVHSTTGAPTKDLPQKHDGDLHFLDEVRLEQSAFCPIPPRPGTIRSRGWYENDYVVASFPHQVSYDETSDLPTESKHVDNDYDEGSSFDTVRLLNPNGCRYVVSFSISY